MKKMKKILFCLSLVLCLILTSCDTYAQTVEFRYSYNGYDVVYVTGLPYYRMFVDDRLSLIPIPRPEWGRIERIVPPAPRPEIMGRNTMHRTFEGRRMQNVGRPQNNRKTGRNFRGGRMPQGQKGGRR